MIIVLIILGIFVLYWRTQNYYYLIDDIVRRWGYLYIVPEESPPPSFYSSKPSRWRHLFLSITHSLNVWIVYLLFGWVPAMLFAFSPLSVPMCSWITGGYYAVTAFFALTSYYFITHYSGLVGASLGSIFFTAALGSTITCLGFPFIFIFGHHSGLALFLPMLMYLIGRRFNAGYQIRNMGKQDSFSLKKIPVMIKTIAYYIHMVVFPYRLGFFRKFGEDYVKDEKVKKDLESLDAWFFVSLLAIVLFCLIGWQFSPIGVIWFICTIAPFSQFKVLGQFVAERYVYLPMIGWCLILGSALAPYPLLLAVVTALYIIRSHFYIFAYEKMETLYEDGMRNFPDCMANYANLGERYIHTGRLQEGRETLEKGLKLDNDNFLCFTNLAAFWINVKNIQKGIYYTEKSIEMGKVKSSITIVRAMQEQLRNLIEFEKKHREEFGCPGIG